MAGVELAVRLPHSLSAGASREEAEDSVRETLAVIERFDIRAERWRDRPPSFLQADLQMHGGRVIGSRGLGWTGDTRLSLEVTSLVPAPKDWQHPLSDPLALLHWLADHAASSGWPLQAGDLVATGSWCEVLEVPPDERVVARFGSMVEVALQRAADAEGMR